MGVGGLARRGQAGQTRGPGCEARLLYGACCFLFIFMSFCNVPDTNPLQVVGDERIFVIC